MFYSESKSIFGSPFTVEEFPNGSYKITYNFGTGRELSETALDLEDLLEGLRVMKESRILVDAIIRIERDLDEYLTNLS